MDKIRQKQQQKQEFKHIQYNAVQALEVAKKVYNNS